MLTLSKPLIAGLTYPYDWGFIPSTEADDGDPLDVLIIHEAATYPGLVLACKPIGVLEVEQVNMGKKERNDRLFVVRTARRSKAICWISVVCRGARSASSRRSSRRRTRSKPRIWNFADGAVRQRRRD